MRSILDSIVFLLMNKIPYANPPMQVDYYLTGTDPSRTMSPKVVGAQFLAPCIDYPAAIANKVDHQQMKGMSFGLLDL